MSGQVTVKDIIHIDAFGMRRMARLISDGTTRITMMRMDVINFEGKNEWLWTLWPDSDIPEHTMWAYTKLEAYQRLGEIFGTDVMADLINQERL